MNPHPGDHADALQGNIALYTTSTTPRPSHFGGPKRNGSGGSICGSTKTWKHKVFSCHEPSCKSDPSSARQPYLWAYTLVVAGFGAYGATHRPQSSSFLGFPYRILNMNPKKELLWGLWLTGLQRNSSRFVVKGLESRASVASVWDFGYLGRETT